MLKLYSYVIAGGQVGYKFRVINQPTSISYEAITIGHTGNVCIGDITPSYKLHIEDGSVFIGDISYTSTSLSTANGHKLIFDNT